jgi:murein DD-endopeptidase MepM/ murein hydrolase activator NlpD
MKRYIYLVSAACLLMLATACTQDAAEVDYKGDEFYGRQHQGALDSPNHEIYPENSPRIKPEYARPVEQAQVQTVAVTDLPAPTKQPPAAKQPAELIKTADAQPATVTQDQQQPHFIWPVVDGKVTSHFGPKSNGQSNDGINIAVAEGEPIWASAAGTVVYAGNDLKDYGNMVIIRHSSGWMTAYAHTRSITVKKDATVKQGDIVAYVGMTGGAKTPQLHFTIRNGRTPVDPEQYLPRNSANSQ